VEETGSLGGTGVHTGERHLGQHPPRSQELGEKEMYEEGNTHLLTLQRRVVFALVLFADDAQLGEVAQLRVYRELTELIVSPG